MLSIKNKTDSLQKMRELGLNFFEEKVFGTTDLEGIENFMKHSKAKEFCMRSTGGVLHKFFFVKNFDEVKKNIKAFKGTFLLGESWRPFKEHIVLLGDIQIKKSENWVNITCSSDQNADHRSIYDNPQNSVSCSMDSDRLWNIRGFSKICAYVTEHNLYDMIVEFVVFDIPVGNCDCEVAIAELRTQY